MKNNEKWEAFISELKAYIEEHHFGPSKRTSLLINVGISNGFFDSMQHQEQPIIRNR